jgi:hypothetical protein
VHLTTLGEALFFFQKKVGENGGKWGKMCNFEAEFEKTGKHAVIGQHRSQDRLKG